MKNSKKHERGVALIIVLSVLAFIIVLVLSAVSLTQYMVRDTGTYSSCTRSMYAAESAANRIYWLLLNDRKKYPQRNIVPDDDSLSGDEERYVADGQVRQMKQYPRQHVTYEIHDAVSGIDVSGAAPQRDLVSMANGMERGSLERKELDALCNKLLDYADADALVHPDGMEEREYLAGGKRHLPRNRPLQYREELLWIPGSRAYFKPDQNGRIASARVIAPAGLPPVSGRPGLYSTPLSQIAERCRLSAIDIEQLQDAFSAWENEKRPLKDSLPAGFLKRLEMYYGSSESGYYTILIDASNQNMPGMRLAVTFKVQFGTDVKRQFYEFMFY